MKKVATGHEKSRPITTLGEMHWNICTRCHDTSFKSSKENISPCQVISGYPTTARMNRRKIYRSISLHFYNVPREESVQRHGGEGHDHTMTHDTPRHTTTHHETPRHQHVHPIHRMTHHDTPRISVCRIHTTTTNHGKICAVLYTYIARYTTTNHDDTPYVHDTSIMKFANKNSAGRLIVVPPCLVWRQWTKICDDTLRQHVDTIETIYFISLIASCFTRCNNIIIIIPSNI